MTEDLSREEVTEAVDAIVEGLLEAAGVHAPPVNALKLARDHLGIQVVIEEGAKRSARRVRDEVRLVLDPGMGEEARQWLAAQAIGSHFKPELLRRLDLAGEAARGMMGESAGSLFGPRVLAPTVWFAREASNLGYDLPALKEKFSTAKMEVLAWRLLDLDEPCIITLVENGSVQRRRSNARQVNKSLSPAEKQCQEYVHAYSRPHVVSEDGWTVQGWPLHEVDWKRELLRSVVEWD